MQEKLQSLIKESILLKSKNARKKLPLGTSKIGGKPHLPADFVWPYYDGTNFEGDAVHLPLTFIAQIALDEIQPLDAEHLLPKTGHLYFFYEVETQPWGFNPEEKGYARVFYTDASSLVEIPFPKDLKKEYRLKEKSLQFENKPSLPLFEEFSDLFPEETIDWDAYEEETAAYGIEEEEFPEENHKLLGYADLIQDSILQQCELIARGLNSETIPKEAEQEITSHFKDWQLLAQFGTLSDEVMFGDCGCIYYYIRKSDLSKKDFSSVHVSLQCS